jgi:hypothetical protein
VAVGIIRMLNVHMQHAHSTLEVVGGTTSIEPGTVPLHEARHLVAVGEAVWIGDPPPEELK